jgi:4-diphosphocytidyl-2-C-methyl-D-erythritol kinase
MIDFPNAKINIGLNIIRKRTDGFHDIETCFYPIGWTDMLEVVASETYEFTSSGLEIPGNGDSNLCTKAYQLLKSNFDFPSVKIHLHKRIPMGAGLGGGSSDAAFTLKLINSIFELGISIEDLKNYARKIGSDCAFFIENKPSFAIGKGDEVQEIPLSLKGKYISLVYPNISIATPFAYSKVQPIEKGFDLEHTIHEPLAQWKASVFNDFETVVFPAYPILETIKHKFYDLGASFAAMSGSGSAIFGIFQTEQKLEPDLNKNFLVWNGFLQ